MSCRAHVQTILLFDTLAYRNRMYVTLCRAVTAAKMMMQPNSKLIYRIEKVKLNMQILHTCIHTGQLPLDRNGIKNSIFFLFCCNISFNFTYTRSQ